MTERVRWLDFEGRRVYGGLALFGYQMALGASVRWYGGQPHMRLYLGPVKLFAGRKRAEQSAYTGGDR